MWGLTCMVHGPPWQEGKNIYIYHCVLGRRQSYIQYKGAVQEGA